MSIDAVGGVRVVGTVEPALPEPRAQANMLVVVANRLPAEYDDEAGWVRSPGGLVTALESVLEGRQSVWVGWSGRFSDASDEADPAGGAMPDRMGDCELVDVKQSVADGKLYYDGFCNSTLWPLYHDTVVPPAYHRRQFDAYRRVNQRFADHVAELAGHGATVWVHDYQLQLVPAMLRKLRPDVTIAYFLHIPFPPIELFQQLPWRQQVLDGLLGADLVGFQTEGGSRNFLALCERLLGYEVEDETVVLPADQGGRRVRAGGFPISIDAAAMDALAATPAVQERARELREELGAPELLLLGIDRLDYTKGIDIRMKAFVELFEDGLLEAGSAVMVQVATPSREMIEEYQRIRNDVELIAGRAMGAVGTVGVSPIHYLHKHLPREELVALYVAADIMLVTPLRDGMNLVAKEYVASRRDGGGALVLSEFAGAAHEMTEAFQVNPHDADGLKRVIMAAVNSPADERRRRMAALRKNVFENDAAHWVDSFMSALAVARSDRDA